MTDDTAELPTTAADPGLSRLECLVGTWEWRGRSQTDTFEVTGHSRVEWLAGNFFLVERGELIAGGQANHSLAVIAAGTGGGACRAHYFDSDGTADVYELDVHDSVVTIDWRHYRFRGTLSEDGQVVAGTWEQSPDGTTWRYWYDLTMTRQGRVGGAA